MQVYDFEFQIIIFVIINSIDVSVVMLVSLLSLYRLVARENLLLCGNVAVVVVVIIFVMFMFVAEMENHFYHFFLFIYYIRLF